MIKINTLLLTMAATLSAWAVEQKWQPLPMQTLEQDEAGVSPGGEGCQNLYALAADSIDGGLILLATDVAGIFRSTDGAKSWQSANLGLKSNGVHSFAIDPKNRDYVLAVGTNSGNNFAHADGVYLSEDGGRHWSHVLAVPRIKWTHDSLNWLAIDEGSYDEKANRCLRAYYALQFSPNYDSGLYRTEDGGVTWTHVAEGGNFGGNKRSPVFLEVHPESGALLIGSQQGILRSEDRGVTFKTILKTDKPITGMDHVPSHPNLFWASTNDQLFHSSDGGKTFVEIPQDGSAKNFKRLHVSPADPLRMSTQNAKSSNRYISHDGGKSWTRSVAQYNPQEILPDGVRSKFKKRKRVVAWHPTNPDVAWGTGPGDLLCRTDDGGFNFKWANNGINNIMIGGLFNFSAHNPDILYFGSQDYNGMLTKNAGEHWNFVNLTISNTKNAVRPGGNDSDAWGWVYGGYTPDGTVIYGGNKEHKGKSYDLWITFDGGKTSERKVTNLKGLQVSYSDPRDENVLFCWAWRSEDRGVTWNRMEGCDGVFIASAGEDATLYGAKGKRVVRSTDHGVSWETVTTVKGRVSDVAYDHINDRLWVAAKNTLYRCDGPEYEAKKINQKMKDHFNSGMLVTTVAVDTADPRIIYAGALGTGLWVQRDLSVARSLDGGETWERLTCNPNYLQNGWITGGQMTSAVRVHPVNRYLYSATCCFGWWKFPPPSAEAVGKPVVDRAYKPAYQAAPVAKVKSVSLPFVSPSGGIVKKIRNFGNLGFEYTFGKHWKNKKNVKNKKVHKQRSVVIDSTEFGGAGAIIGGLNIAPYGQDHFVIELCPLPGNQAQKMTVKFVGSKGGHKVDVDFGKLPKNAFSTLTIPLPGTPGDYAAVEQIQFQGSNFSKGARPFKLAIRRIATTTVAEPQNS